MPFVVASSNRCIMGSKNIDGIHEWLANVSEEFTSLTIDVHKKFRHQNKYSVSDD